MAFLFTIQNFVATPNIETLLISPFKEIWERDMSKNKEIATKEFTYIELYTSKKKSNPYAGYSSDIREKKLKEMLFKKGVEFDSLVNEAIVAIEVLQKEASPTYSYYTSSLEAAQKMKDFLNSFDINEVNEKGVRTFKPNEIIMAISNTPKLLESLNSIKDKVEQELFNITKTKSNKQTNYFEI